MKKKLMIALVIVATVLKFFLTLEHGDYSRYLSNCDMVATLQPIFWMIMAFWCLFESAMDDEREYPYGVVFFLVAIGQLIGFLVWLLFTYQSSKT